MSATVTKMLGLVHHELGEKVSVHEFKEGIQSCANVKEMKYLGDKVIDLGQELRK